MLLLSSGDSTKSHSGIGNCSLAFSSVRSVTIFGGLFEAPHLMFLESMHTGQPHHVSAWFSRLAPVSGVLLFQLVLPRMCLTSQPTCNQTNLLHIKVLLSAKVCFSTKLVEPSRNLLVKCPKVKRSFSFFIILLLFFKRVLKS